MRVLAFQGRGVRTPAAAEGLGRTAPGLTSPEGRPKGRQSACRSRRSSAGPGTSLAGPMGLASGRHTARSVRRMGRTAAGSCYWARPAGHCRSPEERLSSVGCSPE